MIVQTFTPVFAIPTFLIPSSCCTKYGLQEYVQFTFPDPEAVSSALIITASIVLAAALLILSRTIASSLSVAYLNSLFEISTVVMNCHCVIITLSVSGPWSPGVRVQAPVVHSEFHWNKSASPMIGTLSDTAILFPWSPGNNGNNFE